jgi:uncharacterized SAM-binding protein YcdF (DUF218 family)
MATLENRAAVFRSRLLALRVLYAIVGGGLVFAVLSFFGLGRWLVVEDPLVKARAIVVLSGAMPLRAVEAAKLYRAGYAPEIWLTHPAEPAETLRGMGIPFSGEDYYSKLVLIQEGVPPEAIHVLQPPIVNTVDEIRAAADALVPGKNGSVIIVTTKAHTRRVRLLWRRLAPPPEPSHCARRRKRSFRSPALVAHHQRCSRCGTRSPGAAERLGRPASASRALKPVFSSA